MTNLYDNVFIISINDGEEEQNLFDKTDAKKLFSDLVNDPAEHYKNIKLIDYNFNTKEETILDSHEFITLESVLEDAGYELVETSDSLPIVETEPDFVEVNYSQYTTLVYTIQAIVNDIRYIHWNCCGVNFDIIHAVTGEYYNKLNQDLDLLAELALEQPGVTLANPSNMVSKIDWPVIDDSNCINTDYTWQFIRNLIETLLTTLKHNYDNFSSDIQSELDTIIRYWQKELKYKIIRRLEAE